MNTAADVAATKVTGTAQLGHLSSRQMTIFFDRQYRQLRAITELYQRNDARELLNTQQCPGPYPQLFQILQPKHGQQKHVQTTTNTIGRAMYV